MGRSQHGHRESVFSRHTSEEIVTPTASFRKLVTPWSSAHRYLHDMDFETLGIKKYAEFDFDTPAPSNHQKLYKNTKLLIRFQISTFHIFQTSSTFHYIRMRVGPLDLYTVTRYATRSDLRRVPQASHHATKERIRVGLGRSNKRSWALCMNIQFSTDKIVIPRTGAQVLMIWIAKKSDKLQA